MHSPVSGVASDVTRLTKFDDLPEWLRLHQAAALMGLSYWLANQAVHRGEIPFKRVGKVIFVPRSFFDPATASPKRVQVAVAKAVRP